MTYNSARAEFSELRAALQNKESLPWNIGNEILRLVGPKSGVGKKDGSQAKLEEIAVDLAPDFPQYTVAALAKLRNTTQGFPDGIPDGVSWATCESAGTIERLNLALTQLGNKPPLRSHVRAELKAIDATARTEKRAEKLREAEANEREAVAVMSKPCTPQKRSQAESKRAKAIRTIEAASKSRAPRLKTFVTAADRIVKIAQNTEGDLLTAAENMSAKDRGLLAEKWQGIADACMVIVRALADDNAMVAA